MVRTFRGFKAALCALFGIVVSLAAGPAEAGLPRVRLHQLRDGTRLVTARIAGSTQGAFRYVVRSGGSSDPMQLRGLAHVLEHLVFGGSSEVSQRTLHDLGRSIGAYTNARTSADSTVYIVDAQRPGFDDLIAMTMKVVTNPTLSTSMLRQEEGVIATEHVLREHQSILRITDQLVFAGRESGSQIIGSRSSRGMISQSNVLEFYQKHYVPRNTSIVVVGDMPHKEVIAAMEASTRLAPAEEAPPPVVLPSPIVPSENRASGAAALALVGFLVERAQRPHCDAVAELFHLRLRERMRGLTSGAFATCLNLRGQLFLLSFIVSADVASSTSEVLESVAQDVVTRSMTAQEVQVLMERSRRVVRERAVNPVSLADALAGLEEKRGRPLTQTVLSSVLKVSRPGPAGTRAAARAIIVPKHRLLYEIHP